MAERAVLVFVLKQVLEGPRVADQRAARVKRRKRVPLGAAARLACDPQAGAEQLVDLQAEARAALGSAALKRSGDIIIERQRGSHCRTVAPWHHNINIVM